MNKVWLWKIHTWRVFLQIYLRRLEILRIGKRGNRKYGGLGA